jgi:hypothetical protein
LPEPGQTVGYEGTNAVLTGWGYLSFGECGTYFVTVVILMLFLTYNCTAQTAIVVCNFCNVIETVIIILHLR